MVYGWFVMRPGLGDLLSRAAKRSFDITLSTIGLVVLGVPMGVVAVAIKLESAGPVFYRGERVGRYGKTFRIFKFRSMRLGPSTGPDTTSTHDQRITGVGHFIRKFKIDELPQLMSVFKGDMSLVGPRPEVQKFVDLYTDDEKAILSVRPGITDWASIRFHNEGEIVADSAYADPDAAYLALIRPQKIRLQLRYVREHSLRVDLKILAETVATLLPTPNGRLKAKRNSKPSMNRR